MNSNIDNIDPEIEQYIQININNLSNLFILEQIITKTTDLRLTARTQKNCITLQRTQEYSWKKQQSHFQEM